MDHQIPKSLTYPLGTWVHMLQTFPVLSGSLGQRLMGKRWVMDSLTFCSALCSRWKCLVSCMLLTHYQTEKVEYGSPQSRTCTPLHSAMSWANVLHVFLAFFFGIMGLFLLPDYCILRSVARSWVAFHAHLCAVTPYRFFLWYIELDLRLQLRPCFCICSATAFLVL